MAAVERDVRIAVDAVVLPGDLTLPSDPCGAAAALVAVADRPAEITAVVSRGGRPDLAGPALDRVRAPTLLIVGGDDVPVIGLNERAGALMRADVELRIVPGASHLFEEPGALEEVARLASGWFARYLARRPAA